MGLKKSFVLLLLFFIIRSVSAQWDKYPTYQQYLDIMAKFQADYPLLCKVEEFGTSVQERKLLAVKISDNIDTHEKEPAFLYLSSIHGDELAGYVLLLRLADYLLSNYSKDSLVTHLVNNVEIWLSPLANPDGTYKGGDSTIKSAIRYNAHQVDLNRNFPRLPDTTVSPDPEKETKAMIDLLKKHNFTLSGNIHGGAESVSFPWCSIEAKHPDYEWFLKVAQTYIKIAQENGPPGYFNLTGPDAPLVCGQCNRLMWYPVYMPGTLLDYGVFFQHSRNITIELSTTKLLQESQLNNFWSYNKEALLDFIGQVLFGMRGTVTDELTGEPLNAKVFIKNFDKDSSWIFSLLPDGDYYRPIIQGTYSVTFSAPGYITRTISGIEVINNKATVLDVKLAKDQTAIINKNKPSGLTVVNCHGLIQIVYTGKRHTRAQAAIFDMSGRLIRKLNFETGIENQIMTWDRADTRGKPVSNGCYFLIIDYETGVYTKQFILAQ